MPARAVPWFWSDQYDVKLQTAGILGKGYDRTVVRGDPAAAKFVVFYLQGRTLVALDAINAAAEFNIAKRIIGQQDLALEAGWIADPDYDLRQLISA